MPPTCESSWTCWTPQACSLVPADMTLGLRGHQPSCPVLTLARHTGGKAHVSHNFPSFVRTNPPPQNLDEGSSDGSLVAKRDGTITSVRLLWKRILCVTLPDRVTDCGSKHGVFDIWLLINGSSLKNPSNVVVRTFFPSTLTAHFWHNSGQNVRPSVRVETERPSCGEALKKKH